MVTSFEKELELRKASELKHKLQELKEEFLEDVEGRLTLALDRLVEGTLMENTPKINIEKRKSSSEFREKVFKNRNSLLTDLWTVSHMRSAYNICTALFIVLMCNTGLYYAANSTKLWSDLEFIGWAFGNVSIWLSIVVLMHAAMICILYPLYRFWAYSRTPIPVVGRYDVTFLVLYLLFMTAMCVVPVVLLMFNELSPVSNCIVVSEQTRILMKSYAFFRENLYRVINFKTDKDDDKNQPKVLCPEFQKFLYFLFVPTLVYRDSYPRTSKIHWNKVLWLFVQLMACILTTFITFQRFVAEVFHRAGYEPFKMEAFVLILSGCIAVGSIFMFCGFYGFLHCWLNAFAEMLRFGDRTFYEDWWNCTSYHKFYRTWNTVVHDWIHSYLYRDFIKLSRGNQNVALIFVFLISAVVHEYIIAMTLGFLYPAMFFMMVTFGVWVVHLTRGKTSDAWNVFLWWGICCGWGGLFVIYSSEYYSRRNCPSFHEGLADFVVPRSWTCNWLQLPFSGETVNSSSTVL